MSNQNTSPAVMAQRCEDKDSLDNFPTPPWATRALLEHVIGSSGHTRQSCLEPACGQGHMAIPLNEYFGSVLASDIYDYGYGEISDFLECDDSTKYDWVITNPPFRLAESLILKALAVSRIGVRYVLERSLLKALADMKDCSIFKHPQNSHSLRSVFQWSRGG